MTAQGNGPGRGGQRRGYSWAPFAKGHTLSMVHGATSTRTVAPVAERIMAEVAALDPPWLATADGYAVKRWCWLEAQCELLRRYLDAAGLLDDDGKPRPALDTLLRVERLASLQASRLGMDPTSRATLTRDTAVAAAAADAVSAVAAEGRAARLRALGQADDAGRAEGGDGADAG